MITYVVAFRDAAKAHLRISASSVAEVGKDGRWVEFKRADGGLVWLPTDDIAGLWPEDVTPDPIPDVAAGAGS